MQSMMVGGSEFAKFRVSEVRGWPALGFCRLIITFEFFISERPEKVSVLEMGGDLLVKGKRGGPFHAGLLRSISGGRIIQSGTSSHDEAQQFEVELDARRLEAIEDLRLGEELTFTVNLWARTFSESGHHVVHANLEHLVNQSSWVTILGQLQYGKFILLEIPVPDEKACPEMAKAVQHLTEAQQALMNGTYGKAVSDCRLALDAIQTAQGDKAISNDEIKKIFDNQQVMGKADRIRVVRRALHVLCSAAHHSDQVTADFDWERADAISTISMIATLIRWVSNKKQ